ncbi:MAG: HigA family addiction module antitoxin [Paludibacteraceae bacterium]|nr:HigA family addiction module antitoxin [Paludibacteraceae bacterium]
MNNICANNLTPAFATHPGEFLKDELTERGIKPSELADSIEVNRSIISDILHGKRGITAELSVKLEDYLGIQASFWMNAQANYELDTERIKVRASSSKTDALSVANYFVEKAENEHKDITMLMLVKLVYIAQGYSLALLGRPITNSRFDKVEAWKFGPVVPSVYNSFKHCGNNPIKEKTMILKWFDDGNYTFEEPIVKDKDTKFILDKVWMDYKTWSPSKLVSELHQKDTPWFKYYREGKNIQIPDKETELYYKRKLKI